MVVIWHECILDVADVQADYLTEDFVFLFFYGALWMIYGKSWHQNSSMTQGISLLDGHLLMALIPAFISSYHSYSLLRGSMNHPSGPLPHGTTQDDPSLVQAESTSFPPEISQCPFSTEVLEYRPFPTHHGFSCQSNSNKFFHIFYESLCFLWASQVAQW